jgi:hypothetical protein
MLAVVFSLMIAQPAECTRHEKAWWKAVYTDDRQAIRSLVAGGVSPDLVDERGRTALMNLERLDKVETIRTLLEVGANPNAQSGGLRALFLAVAHGQKEVVALLLERGAEVTQGIMGAANSVSDREIISLLLPGFHPKISVSCGTTLDVFYVSSASALCSVRDNNSGFSFRSFPLVGMPIRIRLDELSTDIVWEASEPAVAKVSLEQPGLASVQLIAAGETMVTARFHNIKVVTVRITAHNDQKLEWQGEIRNPSDTADSHASNKSPTPKAQNEEFATAVLDGMSPGLTTMGDVLDKTDKIRSRTDFWETKREVDTRDGRSQETITFGVQDSADGYRCVLKFEQLLYFPSPSQRSANIKLGIIGHALIDARCTSNAGGLFRSTAALMVGSLAG